jgi:pyruvate,water dikinase
MLTALSSSGAAEEPEPNYVIVSDRYVNLHVRFGYHFSRVDAFLDDSAEGNYASLLFHGGAGNIGGRSRRLEFICRILTPRHWRVSRRADALIARIEGLPPRPFEQELENLGRLLMVTRQLDAVLLDDADTDRAVAAYGRGDPAPGIRSEPPGAES